MLQICSQDREQHLHAPPCCLPPTPGHPSPTLLHPPCATSTAPRAPWQCWASHQHPLFHQEGQPSYNLHLQQGSSLQLAILVMSFMKALSGSSLFPEQRPQSSAWLLCPCQLFLMSSLAVPIPRLQVSPSGYAPFSHSLEGAPTLAHHAQ